MKVPPGDHFWGACDAAMSRAGVAGTRTPIAVFDAAYGKFLTAYYAGQPPIVKACMTMDDADVRRRTMQALARYTC